METKCPRGTRALFPCHLGRQSTQRSPGCLDSRVRGTVELACVPVGSGHSSEVDQDYQVTCAQRLPVVVSATLSWACLGHGFRVALDATRCRAFSLYEDQEGADNPE